MTPLTTAQHLARAEREHASHLAAKPAPKFQTILIDPPWPYERTVGQGIAEREYSLMTWPDLHALGDVIASVAAPNAAILMWTCAPLLIETTDMVKTWPFRYITKAFCWVKTTRKGFIFFGTGSHTGSNSEDVWLLSNGSPQRKNKGVSQIVPTVEAVVAQMGRHSRKPEAVQDRIEHLYHGPYLEVFARRRRPGWTCVGNELDGLDIRDSLARLASDEPLPVVSKTSVQIPLFESEAA